MTYGHLRSQGVLVKLEDILETKQLSLALFIVLDTRKIPSLHGG